MCTQQRLRSAWASAQSDQSLLSAWRKLPIQQTVKTLIRLGGCPGWSESSLDTHAIFLLSHWFKLKCQIFVAIHFHSNLTLAKVTRLMRYNVCEKRYIQYPISKYCNRVQSRGRFGKKKSECNDPKFLDRQVWPNRVDPNQTAPLSSLIRVHTVCHSVSIF